MSVTVDDPFAPLVSEVRVATSADDAEEQPDGSIKLTSSDLELVNDRGNDQVVGMRFQGVPVPQGAVVSSAYLQFEVDEVSTIATALTIRGQAADDPAEFTTTDFDVSSRPTTAESIGWSPPPWTTVGAADVDQRSPDLTAVIQEIVSRPDWAAGNSLVLTVTGTGERVAESANGRAAGAPLLHVEYSVP